MKKVGIRKAKYISARFYLLYTSCNMFQIITRIDLELAEVHWQIFLQPAFLYAPHLNDQYTFAEHNNRVDELQSQHNT